VVVQNSEKCSLRGAPERAKAALPVIKSMSAGFVSVDPYSFEEHIHIAFEEHIKQTSRSTNTCGASRGCPSSVVQTRVMPRGAMAGFIQLQCDLTVDDSMIPNRTQYKRFQLVDSLSDEPRAVAGIIQHDAGTREIANVCVSEACRPKQNACYAMIALLVEMLAQDPAVKTIYARALPANKGAQHCYASAFSDAADRIGGFRYSSGLDDGSRVQSAPYRMQLDRE